MKKIRNTHINNFLEEYGCYPEYEDVCGACYYKPTRKFFSLLDKYFIRYTAIPNRL